jgi:hypothetical protein
MAADVAQETNLLEPFLDHILHPKFVESLRDTIPSGTVDVLVYETAVPKRLQLRGIFPFMTIHDLKLAIFVAINLNPNSIRIMTPAGEFKSITSAAIHFVVSFESMRNKAMSVHMPEYYFLDAPSI